MANPRITAELYLQLHQQQVVTDLSDALLSGTDKALKQAQKKITSVWETSVQHALTGGKVGEAQKALLRTGVIEAAEKYKSILEKASNEHAAAMRGITDDMDEATKKRLKREADGARSRTMAEAADTKKILDERLSSYEKELKLMKEAAKEQRAAAGKWAQDVERGAGVLKSIMSGRGLGDMAVGGLKGMAQDRRGKGEDAFKKSELLAQAGKGDEAKQMASMGKGLAKIGASLAMVAAVIGAVVMLVKLFMDLEAKIKEMNKALVQTSSVADFGFSHAEVGAKAFEKELKKIRDETTGLNKNYDDFAAKTKEQQDVLAELNRSGYVWSQMRKDMKGTNDQMRNYGDAAGLVLTYARSIGVESGEMAKSMADLHLKSGITFPQIAEQFSIITREADRAGFQTKRFYAAVVEATSGMSFYGVRIEQTAKLLSTMGALIGQVYGEDVMKQITGKFGGSYQDMLKMVLVKGTEATTDAYRDAFNRKVQIMTRDMGIKDLKGMITEAGSIAKFQDQVLRMNLSGKQVGEMMDLYDVYMASQGNMAAQASSGKKAGPGFMATMALTSSLPLKEFGDNVADAFDKALETDNPALIAALEQLESVSDMSRDELIRLGRMTGKGTPALLKMAKEGGEIPQWAKDLGVTFENAGTEQAKVMKDGIVIDKWQDLFQATVETRLQQKAAMLTERELAAKLYEEVKTLNDTVDQAILGVLNDIYAVTRTMLSLWPGGKSEHEKEALRKKHSGEAFETSANRKKKAAADRKKEADAAAADAASETDPVKKRQKEAGEKYARHQEKKAALESKEADLRVAARKKLKDTGAEDLGWMEAGQQGRGTDRMDAGTIDAWTDWTGGKTDDDKGLTIRHGKSQGMFGMYNPAGKGDKAAQARDQYEEYLESTGAKDRMMEVLGGQAEWDAHLDAAEESAREAGAWTFRQVRKDVMKGFQADVGVSAGKQKGVTPELSGDEYFTGAASSAASSSNPLYRVVGETGLQTIEALRKLDEEMTKNREANQKTAQGVQDGVAIDATKVNDLIIPAGGGTPFITDPADTLLAFKPGGPISQALSGGGGGGGRGGNVQINVHGGDTKKVYDTIMRVLKATGNA